MRGLWTGDDPSTVRLWSLAEDALVEEGGQAGTLVVVSRWGEQVLAPVASSAESLRRMSLGPVALSNAFGRETEGADASEVRELEDTLTKIAGSVVHSLSLPDGSPPLVSAEPLVPAPIFDPVPAPASAFVRLPPTAGLWPVDGVLALEVPGATFRVLLRQPLARLLATSLVTPATTAQLAAATSVPEQVARDVVAFLGAAGVVEVDAGAGNDSPPDLSGWGQHELQFHARSRSRSDRQLVAPIGPQPALARPLPDGPRFPLHRPDLDAVAAADPPLTALLEADHSWPDLAGGPVTADQLGELLYRSARIRSTGWAYLPAAVSSVDRGASQRPYSSVANVYELELYVTLGGFPDLPRGVYHYDPLGHALTLIVDRAKHVDHLLDVGRIGVGSTRRSPVVLTIGARLGRVSWVRPGGSYAMALLHCGALQETLRLVGDAMGMWVRAIPSDAEGVDELMGMRWPAEVGLGECVVDVLRPRR